MLALMLISGINNSSAQPIDTTSKHIDVARQRVPWIIGGNVAAYGGTMIALYSTWYKNYPQSHFHFFNDNNEWLQIDKAGHTWSAYT